MDCSRPCFSMLGIFQARTLECVAISFSRGSSRSRYQTRVFRIAGRHFTLWATLKTVREVYDLLALCLWTSFFTPLSLSPLICTIGVVVLYSYLPSIPSPLSFGELPPARLPIPYGFDKVPHQPDGYVPGQPTKSTSKDKISPEMRHDTRPIEVLFLKHGGGGVAQL